jgi:hypothetical protein
MARQRSNRQSSSPTNRVTEHLRESYDTAAECVADHPTSSMLVTFGAGFAVGILLGYVLAEPPHDERSMLTRVGRNVLDAMGRYIPESVAKHVHA